MVMTTRIVVLALLAGTTLAGVAATAAAAAAAGEKGVAPSAPSLVREIGPEGGATVAATVVELRSGGFVLADAEGGRVRVEARHLPLAGLASGEMVTVTGRLDGGELEAAPAIREDGSLVLHPAGRDGEEDEDQAED
jgi:hypothetical protein